jgi:ArsR family transcriptional regulator, arsenate/arsenite/antimonite-responsive transcriptional repressor
MDQKTAITGLQSLASGPRLDIYRLLVREGVDGLVAGDIAQRLALPPTNLSFHLKALTHAGLLTVTAEGRFQRYRANISMMLDLIGYLTDECCAGRPELCLPLLGEADSASSERPDRAAGRG